MNDEWWTPAEVIEPVRAALGGIDLDPCTTAEAQRVIRAAHYYARPDDGLTLPWRGKVWLNPPYSNPRPWVLQLLERDTGAAACILTATSATGSEAGLLLLACASVIALPGRVPIPAWRWRRLGAAGRIRDRVRRRAGQRRRAARRGRWLGDSCGFAIGCAICDWRVSNGWRLRKLAPLRPATALGGPRTRLAVTGPS